METFLFSFLLISVNFLFLAFLSSPNALILGMYFPASSLYKQKSNQAFRPYVALEISMGFCGSKRYKRTSFYSEIKRFQGNFERSNHNNWWKCFTQSHAVLFVFSSPQIPFITKLPCTYTAVIEILFCHA